MALLGSSRRPRVDYHLVAGIPTPNGPTHLGHLGGPFLRMDILGRFQRLCGNRAFLISGTDAFESHVRMASARTGEPAPGIAGRYHAQIEQDLISLDVVHDAFIDPLDPAWAGRYTWWHHHLLDRLRALGCIERRRERVPFDPRDGRHLLGGFLAGRCPACASAAVGGSCEECGVWFSPATIVEPRCALSDTEPEWCTVHNLYLRLPARDLRQLLMSQALQPEHKQVLRTYLEQQGPRWSMTQQADWGVPAPAEASAPAVFTTYGMGILAYAALLGEAYGVVSGSGVNALAPDSAVITVSAQGFDSIVPDAFAIVALDMLAPELGRYDHLTLNRFLLLEGSKFSTSRQHAIWTREITRVIDSDVIRHYLARVSPDEAQTDFRIDDFVALANEHLVHGLDRRAQESWDVLEGGARSEPPYAATLPSPSPAWVSHLETLLERQQTALDPGRLRLAHVVEALDEWPDVTIQATGDAAGSAYWWLKAAAVLAWSTMPRWARATWQRLGHEGEPSLSSFWHTPPLAMSRQPRHFELLETARIPDIAGVGIADGR